MPCNNLLLLADTENRILAGDQSKFWLLMGQILILVLLVLPSSFTRMRDPSYVLDICVNMYIGLWPSMLYGPFGPYLLYM